MARVSDEFETYSAMFRAKARAEEFDDLNDAVADRNASRYRKHIQDANADSVTGGKRKTAAQRARETLEWLLVNDANYIRLFEGAKSAVGKTAQKAQHIIDEILTRLSSVRDAISDVLNGAMDLRDGRKVFQDKDGIVREENGTAIGDALAAGIIWRGDEPTYEEYRSLRDRETKLFDATDEVRGIQTDIGDLNNQLDDNENPLTPDELEGVSDRAMSLKDRLNAIQTDTLEYVPGRVPKKVRRSWINIEGSVSDLSEIPAIKLASKP